MKATIATIMIILLSSCSTYKVLKKVESPPALNKPINIYISAEVQSGTHPGCPFDKRVMNQHMKNQLRNIQGISLTDQKNAADKVITVAVGCGYEGDFNGPSLFGYIVTISLIPAINEQSIYTSITIQDNKNRSPASVSKDAQFVRSGLSVFFPTAFLVGDSSYTFQKEISQGLTAEIIERLNQ